MESLGIDLPLTNMRIESLYWKADALPNNGRSSFKIIIVSEGSEQPYGCYLIPEYEYPGLVKVKFKSYRYINTFDDKLFLLNDASVVGINNSEVLMA